MIAGLPDAEVYSLRGELEDVFTEPVWAEVHREMGRVLTTGEY